MAELEINGKQVKVNNGDLAIDAYLASPQEKGSYPGIIVIQEIFGVNEHIRDVTQRIARKGYVAIAPAIYQRVAPGFEVGYAPEDLKLGREYKEQTKAKELESDIQATIDYLYSLPEVKKDGIGSIGFCFGGHVVYLVATNPEIKATASFYGAGIANSTPGGGEPTISKTPAIKGTLYGFFGMQDPLIPSEDVDRIETALKKHEIPHHIFRYQDATHGFFCDRRDSYNKAAAADAWEHVLELYQKTLQ